MSWKETCPMNERVRFIGDLLGEERNMSELCTLYGVSPQDRLQVAGAVRSRWRAWA